MNCLLLACGLVHAALGAWKTDAAKDVNSRRQCERKRKKRREGQGMRVCVCVWRIDKEGECRRAEGCGAQVVCARRSELLAESTSPTKCSDRGKATPSGYHPCLDWRLSIPALFLTPVADHSAPPLCFYTVDTRVYLTSRMMLAWTPSAKRHPRAREYQFLAFPRASISSKAVRYGKYQM